MQLQLFIVLGYILKFSFLIFGVTGLDFIDRERK